MIIDSYKNPANQIPVDGVTVVGKVLAIPRFFAPVREPLVVLLTLPWQPLRIPAMVWRSWCDYSDQPVLAGVTQPLFQAAGAHKSRQRCDFPRIKQHLYTGEANLLPNRT